uniref:Uncharacterized protein n=1 Tax=Arundo donax TaxID=35708 RepID=A0A0A9E6M7_ARUDO
MSQLLNCLNQHIFFFTSFS